MTDIAASPLDVAAATPARPQLTGISPATLVIFFGLLTVGLLFTAYSLWTDMTEAQSGASDLGAIPVVGRGVDDRARI
jgi:hypothetical protein